MENLTDNLYIEYSDVSKKYTSKIDHIFYILDKFGKRVHEDLFEKTVFHNSHNGQKYLLLFKITSLEDTFYRKVICIVESETGKIVKEFNHFESPYLMKDSCLYLLNNEYVHIENGFSYGKTIDLSLESSNYFFTSIRVNDQKIVRRIDKTTGDYKDYK